MNFEKTFPLRFWINLGRREDRRVETAARLLDAGISAKRFAAIDLRRVSVPEHTSAKIVEEESSKEVRGYANAGYYALAATQRLVIREAKRQKAEAVLLLEDDVVIHPNFQALIDTVDLPEDWGIFYLGCAHHTPPEWAGTRVVRVTRAVDTHAVAIRYPYYDRVMSALNRHLKPDSGVAKAPDQFLALLHEEIPTYACYPNLMWQDVSGSDLAGKRYSNYTRDGRQRYSSAAVDNLLPDLLGANFSEVDSSDRERGQGKTRIGLLFLCRGDVHHPEIWREFIQEAPDRITVFSHPKFKDAIKGGFLEGTEIAEQHETEWGSISLVHATRSLLKAALQDESLTHFILLSESCVPICPLPEILRRLDIDPRSQFEFKNLDEACARHVSRIVDAPAVPSGCWKFQPQWWLMNRVAAAIAVGQDFTQVFEHMFVPDEAYFATVLSMQGYPIDGEVLNRCSTWTWWEKDAGSPTQWIDIPPEKIRSMMESGAYFARKFPKGSKIGTYGLHRSNRLALLP